MDPLKLRHLMIVMERNQESSQDTPCAACGDVVLPIYGWTARVERDVLRTDKVICAKCVKYHAPDLYLLLQGAVGGEVPEALRRSAIGVELAVKLGEHGLDVTV